MDTRDSNQLSPFPVGQATRPDAGPWGGPSRRHSLGGPTVDEDANPFEKLGAVRTAPKPRIPAVGALAWVADTLGRLVAPDPVQEAALHEDARAWVERFRAAYLALTADHIAAWEEGEG